MCNCGCFYEDYEGECRKPRHAVCPGDSENGEWDGLPHFLSDEAYDRMVDERMAKEWEAANG